MTTTAAIESLLWLQIAASVIAAIGTRLRVCAHDRRAAAS
jgi:hypothetical protein